MPASPFQLPLPTDELIRRYEVAGPRYTSYPTAPEWRSEFDSNAYLGQLRAAARETAAPLSLYTHLPFCHAICAYCGCNAMLGKTPPVADRYLDHLERELALAAEALGARRTVSQLHWGGGTPTFLTETQLTRLFRSIAAHFTFTPGAELAVELDPSVTTRSQLERLRSFGFNRLSMGVQDFDPRVQRAIHRLQPAEETAALLGAARALGITAVNFDLIYGLPLQTIESWGATLERVVAMRPDRLAIYSFAYLPALKPNQRKIRAEELPQGPEKLRLFQLAYQTLLDAGYRPIGMDHFALPEDELAQAQEQRKLHRNFQGYTVASGTDTVAFGVTGISDIAGAFAQSVRPLPGYYRALAEGRFAIERGLLLSPDDRRRRALITQLMCNFWADLGSDGYFEPEWNRLAPFESDGLLHRTGTEIELTPLGRLFVRNVAMVFDTYLGRDDRTRTFSRTV